MVIDTNKTSIKQCYNIKKLNNWRQQNMLECFLCCGNLADRNRDSAWCVHTFLCVNVCLKSFRFVLSLFGVKYQHFISIQFTKSNFTLLLFLLCAQSPNATTKQTASNWMLRFALLMQWPCSMNWNAKAITFKSLCI